MRNSSAKILSLSLSTWWSTEWNLSISCFTIERSCPLWSFQFWIQGKLASYHESSNECSAYTLTASNKKACFFFVFRVSLVRQTTQWEMKITLNLIKKVFVASVPGCWLILVKYSISWYRNLLPLTWANDFVCWFRKHNYPPTGGLRGKKESKIDIIAMWQRLSNI